MSKLRLSVVLPAYKGKYLRESIASILAQTYRDFELIVVDDCSPDGIDEIVRSFDDVRISYYRNAENLGGKDLVAAWNKALSHATGDWCVLAGDDDVYLPGFLEEMVRLSEKYPFCDLFHGRLADMDADGNWIGVSPPWPEYCSQIEFAYGREVWGLLFAAPDFMFRLSAFREVGGFESFPMAWYTDVATWFKLARNGVGCSAQPLYCSRHSGINISTRTDNVRGKTVSSERFKAWFAAFAEKLVPTNQTDATCLKDMVRKVSGNVDAYSMELMRGLSFGEWRKCYRLIQGEREVRRQFLFDRFPVLKMLRDVKHALKGSR